MQRALLSLAARAAAACLLAACGGGGGGEEATPPPPPKVPQLALLAGHAGGAGNLDGAVEVARFDGPASVVVDLAGNRYIADTDNHVIRRLGADGRTVATFAGRSGEAGNADGSAADARFRSPEGLLIDKLALYVADTGNRMIRRIDLQSGQVQTLAGAPPTGPVTTAVDGSAGRNGAARFSRPVALAFAGTSIGSPLLIADAGASAIRMLVDNAGGGTVSTIAGTLNQGDCNSATPTAVVPASNRLCAPSGLAYRRSDGRVYFTQPGNSVVRAVAIRGAGTAFGPAAQNDLHFVAGSPTNVDGTADGLGAQATFDFPQGIAANDDGELIVGQIAALRRIRIGAEGARVDTLAGSKTRELGNVDGSRADARFSAALTGVSLDGSGKVLVADRGNHLIRRFDATTQRVDTLGGQRVQSGNDDGAAATARFVRPEGISLAPDGSATLVDGGSEHVRRIDIGAGQVSTLAVISGVETIPTGVVAAEAGQAAAIVGRADHSVRRVDGDAARLLAGAGFTDGEGFADGPGTTARFSHPSAIVRDATGLLWVADRDNHRIRTVAGDGRTSTFAGQSDPGLVDGPVALSRWNRPVGLAFGKDGQLFVLEAGNRAIRRIAKDAQGQSVVGTVVQGLGEPNGLAIDAAGNLYVSDAAEHTVRRYRPGAAQGEIVVGTPRQCGFVAGALPGVICAPRGIAVRDGRLVLTMDQGVMTVDPLPP